MLKQRHYETAQALLSFACQRPVLGLLEPLIQNAPVTSRHRWKITHRARCTIAHTIIYLERKYHEQSARERAVHSPVPGLQAGQEAHRSMAGVADVAIDHRRVLRLGRARAVLVESI